MSETEIRHRDIDTAAAALVGIVTQSPEQWDSDADRNHGRTRRVYRRCAVLAQFAEDLRRL